MVVFQVLGFSLDWYAYQSTSETKLRQSPPAHKRNNAPFLGYGFYPNYRKNTGKQMETLPEGGMSNDDSQHERNGAGVFTRESQ